MIGIELHLEVRNHVTEKVYEAAVTRAEVETLAYWREKYLPEHFTPQASQKYRYFPRSQKYEISKLARGRKGKARYGGEVDNVLTGKSEDLIKSGAVIKAEPGKARMLMPTTYYFDIIVPNGPDKVAEITTVTDEENNELAIYFAEKLQAHLDWTENAEAA